MSNGGSQQTSGGGGSGAVAPVGAGFVLADIAKGKPRKPFKPILGIPIDILRNREMQATTQRKIDRQIAADGEANARVLARLEKLKERELLLAAKFERKRARKPRSFLRAGIPLDATLAQIINIALEISGKARRTLKRTLAAPFTPQGQVIIDGFHSPAFTPQLPPITGGRKVSPFNITPGPSAGGSGFDFGGFLDTGLRIAERFLAPKQSQIISERGAFDPRFQQASLVPFLSKIPQLLKRPLIGGAAGGFAGQGLFEGFENLFGGASTDDDAAAFTDPIPGSCRPKTHLKVNPCTGKSVWFTPRGRPLVFSGDLSACKRVDRVSKRLGKAMPRRRSTGHVHHRRKR